MTQAEILEICRQAAAAAGIPTLLLVACGVAESNLNPAARRPSNPADDPRYWVDVSGGLFQQTVRWDPDYHGGAAYPGEAEIERVLALQYDPARSARIAAANLKPKWARYGPDMLATLCAYNAPALNGTPASPAVEANYRRGLAEAASLLGDSTVAIKLSEVLARGRSRTGDPYVWDGEVPGAFDCSGFVKYCYNGTLTSFTDTIFGETQRVDGTLVAPGDIVLYEYADTSQPGVRFPHVALYLTDTTVLDARWPMGVGEHEQLARSKATRYYRRAPGVVADTVGGTPPSDHPVYFQPGDVGTGLLQMMQADGTEPAMPSVFLPLGRSPSMIEECIGLNGTTFRWHIPTGKSWKIKSA